MRFPDHLRARLTAVLTTSALVAGGLTVSTIVAPQASADVSPIAAPASSTVTADALPTVQIDGVVWDQAIVGNTVWAGGQFANARPAGAAPGTQLTTRNNLLAYNLTTGALITSIAPSLNAQVKAVAVSPDKKRVYVGGAFTTANGVKHNRIAAYDATTGAIINSFAPNVDATVNAIVATDTTVYVGGIFTTGGGLARPRLAAFSAVDGKPTAWAPTSDGTVNAMVLSPAGQVVVGGAFQNLNGSPAYGLGALDPVTGALLPWNATAKIRNAGKNAAITSLSTDGNAIYGTAYHFGAGGNLEGTFSADPASGDVTWVEDCHGDTYDAYSDGTQVYTVSHAHYCGNLGGFFQSDPWSTNMRHALAFTTNATGTLQHDPHGYFDWFGTPSPSMINWFPDLEPGDVTGKGQAAWSVTGNGQYVVMGGEFPLVNRVGQQGLVRFAVDTIAPKKVGPDVKGGNSNPTVLGLSTGAARVTWQANSDMDDNTLTYRLTRNGVLIHQVEASSTFWNRPTMGYIDPAANLVPGTVYRYRLTATDADGNTATSENVNFTAPAAGATSAYTTRVLADGASPYWPMNETSGNVLFDNSSTFNDADASAGLTRSVAPGAIAGDTASSFDGTGSAATRTAVVGPNTFTVQAWINTTTTNGGKIIGFGNNRTGNSGSYDRHVYMDGAGRIFFGVYPGWVATVNSGTGYNDGQWHQITASMGAGGMTLSIDGKQVAQRSDVTSGQAYSGYWRVGGDNTGGWPNVVSNNFAGAIDEVAVYPTVLSRPQIDAQWVAAGRTSTIPAPPTDPYGATVYNDSPLLFWRLGESAGATTAVDSGPNGDQTGVIQNGVTLGVPGGIKGTAGTAAAFDGADDLVASTNSFVNPRNYAVEAWFKTTSTNGGKIIGFGTSQTGTSGGYDRHIYMTPDGKVTFGVWTGFTNTITSPTALNDGVWHHVVGSQTNAEGMRFYVDGVLVGSNGQTGADGTTGYWRVGGDNHWGSGSRFINATIDDVAVYSGGLTAAQVKNHFTLGNTVTPPNQAPVAGFTSATTFLDASFTSSSTDADGTIASSAWNFGDGASSTDVNPTHTYAAAGTYTVTLTVTDDKGATTTVSNPVTVTAAPVNQAPVAAFTATAAQLTANVDAAGSSDPDGTIASYAWNFGDGFTTTGVTASHAYNTAGSKTITLTVTDNQGKTTTTSQPIEVTAPPVNQAPVAGFTQAVENLTVNVESTSTDPDGSIASQSWNFGDGTAAVTSAVATHTYATAGSYTVTLTVVDNSGASRSATQTVTVTAPPPANVAPTAVFASATAGLQVSVDGAASKDPDGTIAAYAWNFGDGSTDLVTTATATHTYAVAGTYQVTLTVTDDNGATHSVTAPVTVSSPAATPLISDTFSRTSTSGWGTADIGGAWTVTGGASNFTVNGGTGKVRLNAAGSGPTATLGATTAADVSTSVSFAMDKAPTGAGLYMSLGARKVGNSEYRATARLLADGSVVVQLSKTVAGASTSLRSVTVNGLSYKAGDSLNLKFDVTGSASVALGAKIWKSGTTEPATWQATATDASSPLPAGTVALYPYLSGSSTNAPVVVTFDDLAVKAVKP
ncbi:PKD domain-containing protein [Nakamurella deserti]|uniref:PKD domain-containing protein n=1 Tax=Nakamurella deserti TaxID=2164074 RepID=UPI000DBE5202|nr:PKD domain-containing protein [Nakamurella deserti]